jgi:hypothetical protein
MILLAKSAVMTFAATLAKCYCEFIFLYLLFNYSLLVSVENIEISTDGFWLFEAEKAEHSAAAVRRRRQGIWQQRQN